ELKNTVLGEDVGIGVGSSGVDAEQRGVEVVDADGVAVEVSLESRPRLGLGQSVEQVGQAVVLEVEGADGLAKAGLEGQEILLCPWLQLVETVVALREQEGQPDTDDLPGSQVPLPE